MNTIYNRLQFVHHEEVFKTREEAYSYAVDKCADGRPALLAEPMVLFYESGSQAKGPNVILALGSAGDGTSPSKSKIFFIDTEKTEEELISLGEKLDAAIKSLQIHTVDSDTLDLSSEVTSEGTVVSGDVRVADYEVYGYGTENIIESTEHGLYAFVGLEYDDNTDVLKFKVNGVTKSFQLPKDQHVVGGKYCPIYKDEDGNLKEAIVLNLADGTVVPIYVEQLINEWTTLGDSSTTPVTLKRTRMDAQRVPGGYEWKDVLEGDVRVADQFSDNILVKTGDTKNPNRYLYVKGTADNIKYKDGMSVKDAIENAETKISTSAGNILYARPDGIYAAISVKYDAAKNTLIFRYSDAESKEMKEVSYELNSVQLLNDITYDPLTESIVLRYINEKGEYNTVSIPASSIIEEWEVLNEGHNVRLVKSRQEGKGHDILTADVRISPKENNIIEEVNHELYVGGVARNIKLSIDPSDETTVEDAINSLKQMDSDLSIEIDKNKENIEKLGEGLEDACKSMVTYLQSSDNSIALEEVHAEDGASKGYDVKVRLSTLHDNDADGNNSKKNIIVSDGANGIHADVDLTYNPLSNTLYFTTTNGSKAFALQSNSLVKNIVYVSEEESIVITYVVDREEKVIKVPLRGLINEWTVANTDTVNLKKEIRTSGGSDILTAEVAICPSNIHDDNILVVDNGLYVSSGHIKTYADEVVANEKAERQEQDNALGDLIQTLSGEVKTETAERKDADKALNTAIDAVSGNVDALSGKVDAFSGNVNTAVSELKDADKALSDAIDANKQAIASLDNDIKAETYRATLAEQSINDSISTQRAEMMGAINAEVTRATGAEDALRKEIEGESSRLDAVDTSLKELIANETARAKGIEDSLSGSIASETAERSANDTKLLNAINAEVTRATNTENALSGSITTEASLARQNEQAISGALDTEIARAERKESEIASTVASEAERAKAAEGALTDSLNALSVTRKEEDDKLQAQINALNDAQLSFSNTQTVELIKNGTTVTGNVILANANENILKVDSVNAGLYSTVDLSYNAGNNMLTFTTTNGSKDIQLNAGSIIDSITYDSQEKKIVISYSTTDGGKASVDVAVADLYNEWIVSNPSEGSAVELTKAHDTAGGADILSSRVLLTNLSDNCVTITNNGLYVSGNAIREDAKASISGDIASLQEEIDRIESAGGLDSDGTYNKALTLTTNYIKDNDTLIGNDIILDSKLYEVSGQTVSNTQSITEINDILDNNQEEIDRIEANAGLDADGNYVPNRSTNYIYSADTLTDADRILDAEVKNVNARIDSLTGSVSGVSGDISLLQAEIDRIEAGAGLNEDGTYRANVAACVISSANSLMEADQYLDKAVCDLQTKLDRILIGKTNTPTAMLYGDAEDDNTLKVNVRLSRGNSKTMGEDETVITSTGSTEFTDTNVLRVVAVSDMIPESEYNGLYLSNVWDCGEYVDGVEKEYDYSNKRV